MNLPVVPAADSPSDAPRPWYADGLDFTCTTCGNCCTGGPGYVFVTDREIELAAGHLGVATPEFRKRYCRRVGDRVSFKEVRRPNGLHDCVFLTEVPAPPPAGGARELAAGEEVPLGRRVCGIYAVRPLQCRTWPFWPENLRSPATWNRAAKGCPGMNRGGRHFTPAQVEAVRDAAEWPAHPPTSAAGERGEGLG